MYAVPSFPEEMGNGLGLTLTGENALAVAHDPVDALFGGKIGKDAWALD